jgi:hypothetical protein
MKNYGKLTLALIVGWFFFALFASAIHLFKTDADRIGLAVAITALSPIVVFSLWFAASRNFRQFVLSLNSRILTSAQSWETPGIRVRPSGSPRHSPSDLCIARRLRRHGHRRHRCLRGVEAL